MQLTHDFHGLCIDEEKDI